MTHTSPIDKLDHSFVLFFESKFKLKCRNTQYLRRVVKTKIAPSKKHKKKPNIIDKR